MAVAEHRSDIKLTTDTHTSPSRASYGVSVARILEKNGPRFNGTALYLTAWQGTRIVRSLSNACQSQAPITLWWHLWMMVLKHFQCPCTDINSLAPRKFEWNLRFIIFKWSLVIAGWGISHEIALMWMSLDLTDDQSTLVQVMAWCCQTASHYLSQCWPRSLSPYGVTRPQWVKGL